VDIYRANPRHTVLEDIIPELTAVQTEWSYGLALGWRDSSKLAFLWQSLVSWVSEQAFLLKWLGGVGQSRFLPLFSWFLGYTRKRVNIEKVRDWRGGVSVGLGVSENTPP
jgi:hypothetical protein